MKICKYVACGKENIKNEVEEKKIMSVRYNIKGKEIFLGTEKMKLP